MLFKLALLLSAICAISPETVEIECSYSVEYCLVRELPENLPVNATWKFLCPQNCTRIVTQNANFSRFPRELWNSHQQVTALYLGGTDFEELTIGDFFYAAKLIEFVLIYNKKPLSLRNNCFWGASKLLSLNIYGSTISEMEGGAFNGIPLLDQLQLVYNNISHISNDHFRNLPNLRYFILYSNTIERIESDAFLHNTNLDYININYNNLTELDLLLPFINTRQIDITDNQLTKFIFRSISQEITEVNYGTTFNLKNNKLTELYIQSNFAVEHLWLVENLIERIDALPVLMSLKELNLQKCEIKSLDGQRFADRYVNLKTLYLTSNNINRFSKEMFVGLDKLQELWMDDNELTEVDFPPLKSLTYLNLTNNSLKEFPYGEDIRDTFPALGVLDIRNNDFDENYLADLVKTIEDQGIVVWWEPMPLMGL